MDGRRAEGLVGPEWTEWYALTPEERLAETDKLWDQYIRLRGSLDPEPDPQSPFFDPEEWRANLTDGRPGLCLIRRGGV